MSFELSGKLIEKFDTTKITDSFQKREFVLETSDDQSGRTFTEHIKFQLTQDRCNLLDDFNINDNMKVSFNIRGRKWEKEGRVNYFTNLEAWKIEALGQGSATPAEKEEIPKTPFPQSADEDDDLPF